MSWSDDEDEDKLTAKEAAWLAGVSRQRIEQVADQLGAIVVEITPKGFVRRRYPRLRVLAWARSRVHVATERAARLRRHVIKRRSR